MEILNNYANDYLKLFWENNWEYIWDMYIPIKMQNSQIKNSSRLHPTQMSFPISQFSPYFK